MCIKRISAKKYENIKMKNSKNLQKDKTAEKLEQKKGRREAKRKRLLKTVLQKTHPIRKKQMKPNVLKKERFKK